MKNEQYCMVVLLNPDIDPTSVKVTPISDLTRHRRSLSLALTAQQQIQIDVSGTINTSADEIEIIGEAVDSAGAVKLYETLNPDIIILDIDLKDGNGIEVLTRIKNNSPSPTTIMFTNYSNSAYQKAAKRLGADYFFDKTNDVEKLVNTVMELSLK